MVSKASFYFQMALVWLMLAFATYPPNPSNANYFLTWCAMLVCSYHGVQFVRWFCLLLNLPEKPVS